MAHLRWSDDAGESHSVTLGDAELVVGRSPECDVIISKGYVSRRHCRIFRHGDGWAVADLGSTGGTFVNRIRVSDATPLAPGDRIMARTELLMTFESGPPPKEEKRRKTLGELGVVPGEMQFPVEKTGDVEGPDPEAILSAHSIETSDYMSALNEAKSLDLRSLAASQSSANHLARLVKVSEALRRCADVSSVCNAALELAMESTGAARGIVALRSPDGVFERVVERGGSTGESVRISRTFVDKMVRERSALIATDATHDLALAGARSIVAAKIRSILAAPLWDGDEILGYLYLDTTEGAALVRLFTKEDLNLLIAICHQGGAEIGRHRLGARIREEEARRKNLARMVSADVIKHIEEEHAKGQDLTFTAKEQEVTILFADLQGFTAMAERLKASDIKNLLDDYFDRMTEILVDDRHGTLDKYMGDAIMALFGAPFPNPKGPAEDAVNAVQAAIDMRDAVEALRKKRSRVYGQVHMRCGINTGRVVAGMLGSQRRLEYSVVGDVVNVASRVESTGEAGRIQIGEATYEAVKDRNLFVFEFAGERKVKNREKPIRCWWVNGRV